MKKCPVCEKTFEDSMRCCQTDGTPLNEFVEAPADDPLKTTVVRQEDFASVIPPEDPFKSSSVESTPKDDSGDLLQLPEEYDPMKTMVAPNQADYGLNLSEPNKETPVSPFDTPFETKIDEKPPEISAPEPPKFSEPNLSPPSFGDMSTPMSFEEKKEEEPPPTAIYMPEANSFPPESSTPMSSSPFDRPMEKPLDAPIPSPFDSPTPQYPSFKDPEPFTPSVSPFEQPASPFGGIEQQNQGFNQPVQNSDWQPQTPAATNWQDQGGANAQFPPVAGAGQDQTMAIVALVCGIAGFLICPLTAPVGLVTGYMARKKAQENPQQFGGEGLALAGMIIGGIVTVIWVGIILLYALIIFGAIASGF
ncbi:MAG TPA: DUF4190 domain-containing protein [Pyrinomonadaceae bacterium]|nr:DUF4190 domain-containing protein [Pyrinomonadaceae bacterium]